uniref:protein-L-isoaspartate(D-aspartate) O-methyltransferase n=1 Tax=Heterorhabditis bacteriophora TaxID=37862 RepID=A0A1I7XHV0_HETBA
MAWRCSGSSNRELIDNLQKGHIFSSHRVRDAMIAVDRGDFAPHGPYLDQPQGIGWNATISAPHMHASALEYLKDHLVEGACALDVGSGSGYLTTCMARMGDGRLGYPIDRKYDAIHVGAAAENVPAALIDQLAEGGRMLIPVGRENGDQVFLQIDKRNNQLTETVIERVIYVPLTSKAHQLSRYDY